MSNALPVDGAVLLFGVLLALGVVAGVIAGRLRVPGLVLFLGLGMLVADDGLALVRFDDAALAQNVGAIALAIILFEGGLATAPGALRRAGSSAAALATLGVVITAGVVAVGAEAVFGLGWPTALLIGAVVCSTDAAAVFGALRNESLPRRVRDLLQLESGGNDPVAVLLTIGMVETWRSSPDALDWVLFGSWQLGGGIVIGAGAGLAAASALRKLRLGSLTSTGVLGLAVAAVAYGAAAMAGSSGFLSVYVAGLVLSRERRLVRSISAVHEGLAATAQASLFLMLGMLVFPSELVEMAGRAMIVAATLVFVARPLAVAAIAPWFRFSPREQALVAWCGLRGAVPIVLATIPLTAGHPDGALVFEVAFVVVVVSVLVQAPLIGPLVARLGLTADAPVTTLEVIPIETMDADVVEVRLGRTSAAVGRTLADRPPPGPSRVAVIVRGDRSTVPDGSTVLLPDDTLIIAAPPEVDPGELARWAE